MNDRSGADRKDTPDPDLTHGNRYWTPDLSGNLAL